MLVDKNYCMNSFLMYRTVIDKEKCFTDKLTRFYRAFPSPRTPINNSDELLEFLRVSVRGLRVKNALWH